MKYLRDLANIETALKQAGYSNVAKRVKTHPSHCGTTRSIFKAVFDGVGTTAE